MDLYDIITKCFYECQTVIDIGGNDLHSKKFELRRAIKLPYNTIIKLWILMIFYLMVPYQGCEYFDSGQIFVQHSCIKFVFNLCLSLTTVVIPWEVIYPYHMRYMSME